MIILDLGCGTGASIDFFQKIVPNARWIGVDIEDSPEVNSRTRNDAEFFLHMAYNFLLVVLILTLYTVIKFSSM